MNKYFYYGVSEILASIFVIYMYIFYVPKKLKVSHPEQDSKLATIGILLGHGIGVFMIGITTIILSFFNMPLIVFVTLIIIGMSLIFIVTPIMLAISILLNKKDENNK